MQTPLTIIAQHDLAALKPQIVNLEVTLMDVAGDIRPYDDAAMAIVPDIQFSRLRAALDVVTALNPEMTAAVAGPAAGEALQAYREAFTGLFEIYGLACGPDREIKTERALHAHLRAVATRALAPLTTLMAAIVAVEAPTAEAYVSALGAHRRDQVAKRRAGNVTATATTILRDPTGEEVARTARILLGLAYGGLTVCHANLTRGAGADRGKMTLEEISSVASLLSVNTTALTLATPFGIQAAFASHVEGIADDLDATYTAIETEFTSRRLDGHAADHFATRIAGQLVRVGGAIQKVDALAAESGYAITAILPGSAGPSHTQDGQ